MPSPACPHATKTVHICFKCLITGVDTPQQIKDGRKMESKQQKTEAKMEKFKIWLNETWKQVRDDQGVLESIECGSCGKQYARKSPYTATQAISYFGSMAEVHRRKCKINEV